MTSTAITFRQASEADRHELRDLAQLDSQRLSDGTYAVAEMNGRIVAALNRADGSAIADPFEHTAGIVQMLRAHAGTATVSDTRRHLSVRRLRTAIA
jgi:hypothetical protein